MKTNFANYVKNLESQAQVAVQDWSSRGGSRTQTRHALSQSIVKSIGAQDTWREISRYIDIAVAAGQRRKFVSSLGSLAPRFSGAAAQPGRAAPQLPGNRKAKPVVIASVNGNLSKNADGSHQRGGGIHRSTARMGITPCRQPGLETPPVKTQPLAYSFQCSPVNRTGLAARAKRAAMVANSM